MREQENSAQQFFLRGQKEFEDGNFQSCIKDLIYAQEIFSSIGMKEQSAQALLLTAQAYHNINQITQSRQFYSLALSRFRELNNTPKIGECAMVLGITYREEGDFKKSKQYLAEAIEVFTTLNDYEKLADSWRGLALTYQIDLTQYSEHPVHSINAYRKAILLFKKLKKFDKKAETEHDLGHILISQSKYHEALEVFQEALDYYKKQNDKEQIIPISILIGRIYFELGKKPKAKDYMNKAIEEMKKYDYSPEKINMLKQSIIAMFSS
ncbi:tetratricopeptide repeat protein [Candidatus Heimdallarchaeota archaeon]|nr:MAG: tetratricopeptide repeat protein [Candidatus Heimdallarchaeota archaeon]